MTENKYISTLNDTKGGQLSSFFKDQCFLWQRGVPIHTVIIALAENFEKVDNQYTHITRKISLVWNKIIDMESPVRIELTTVC